MDATKLLDSFVDAELLARVARQDAEAFTLFYSRTSDVLYPLALSILRDPQLAEDVLQEVYTRIWSDAEAFDPTLGKPIAWVIALTRNKALDRLRSSKRRDLAMKELAETPDLEKYLSEPSTANAETTETIRLVEDALVSFSEGQRQALKLALFHGLSHVEVAKVMEQPLGTVKAWLRRGMIELRDRLRRLL